MVRKFTDRKYAGEVTTNRGCYGVGYQHECGAVYCSGGAKLILDIVSLGRRCSQKLYTPEKFQKLDILRR